MNTNKAHLVMATLLLAALIPSAQSQNHSDRQQLLKAWNQPFKGFRIIGNIYYVGTNNLACFLITSSEGHMLVDTAMEESGPLVRANIEALGFKLKDIRIILSSHAHFDHVAGHADMKAATVAQVLATAPDAATLESGGRKGFHPLMAYKPVKVDRVIKDGEIVRLGNIAMTAHMVPGHTEGNTAWTTTIEDKGKTYVVVFAASMSINPGVRMVNNPTWPGIAEAYAASFVKLSISEMRRLPWPSRPILQDGRESETHDCGLNDEPIHRSGRIPGLSRWLREAIPATTRAGAKHQVVTVVIRPVCKETI